VSLFGLIRVFGRGPMAGMYIIQAIFFHEILCIGFQCRLVCQRRVSYSFEITFGPKGIIFAIQVL
jgi:hypothetical protein